MLIALTTSLCLGGLAITSGILALQRHRKQGVTLENSRRKKQGDGSKEENEVAAEWEHAETRNHPTTISSRFTRDHLLLGSGLYGSP